MYKKLPLFVTCILLWSAMAVHAQEASWLCVQTQQGKQIADSVPNIHLLLFEEQATQNANTTLYDLVVKPYSGKEKVVAVNNVRKIYFTHFVPSKQEDVVYGENRVFVDENRLLTAESPAIIQGIQVLNLAGQIVYSERVTGGLERMTLYAPWAQGLYIVLLETTQGHSSHKILLR